MYICMCVCMCYIYSSVNDSDNFKFLTPNFHFYCILAVPFLQEEGR